MNTESTDESCSALTKEQISENRAITHMLLDASFRYGEHNAFKEHMENNPVPQDFGDSLAYGMRLVTNNTRTLSDVAPTLTVLLQCDAKWDCNDQQPPYVTTPYHVICRGTGDHYELLELVIRKIGVTLMNAKDDNQCTALMYAVHHVNMKCVQTLISNRANVNTNCWARGYVHNHEYLNILRTNPLIDSINLVHPDSQYPSNVMMDIFDLLLDSGADVNQPCYFRDRTPVMYAAAVGNASCAKKLIQKGAEVNFTYKERSSSTVLTLAARSGNAEMLKLLLKNNNFDKNLIDKEECLYWAVRGGSIISVRYILNLGVTITTKIPKERKLPCMYCNTMLTCSLFNGRQLMIQPYIQAIRLNMTNVMKLLEEHGCELYKSTEVLSYAVRIDCVKVVDYLLRNHTYPLNNEYVEAGHFLRHPHKTLISKACKIKSVRMVRLLLEHGADPNQMNSIENCPSTINVAIYERHVEVIALLIRSGVNVNSRSFFPRFGNVLPIGAAVCHNHVYAVKMLLVTGCSHGVHCLDKNYMRTKLNTHELETILKKWNLHENSVLPLKQRCRLVIRYHLYPQADKKITKLPLPPIVIKYLHISELDDIIEAFKNNPHSNKYVK